MLDADKLRQELAGLKARIKSPAQWTSFQDHLDQKLIAQRIRMLENYLNNDERTERKTENG